MPRKPARSCRFPRCPNTTHALHGFCSIHESSVPQRKPDQRPSRPQYGSEWRKIRKEVLFAYGISESEHHLYDVDHRPAYNAAIEPDHRKYELVPMLHANHSRKTATLDGAFGNPRGGSIPSGNNSNTESYRFAQAMSANAKGGSDE